MFSLRSPTRPIGLALICLMILTQASCATLQMSASLGPPPGEGESGEPGESVTDLSGMGTAVVVVAVAFVGYLLYKAITRDRGEAEGEPESDSSTPPPGCPRPMTPCMVPSPPS